MRLNTKRATCQVLRAEIASTSVADAVCGAMALPQADS